MHKGHFFRMLLITDISILITMLCFFPLYGLSAETVAIQSRGTIEMAVKTGDLEGLPNNENSIQKKMMHGMIQSVDAVLSTLTIRLHGKEYPMQVDTATVIESENNHLSLKDCIRGDIVTVWYYIPGPGRRIALHIDNETYNTHATLRPHGDTIIPNSSVSTIAAIDTVPLPTAPADSAELSTQKTVAREEIEPVKQGIGQEIAKKTHDIPNMQAESRLSTDSFTAKSVTQVDSLFRHPSFFSYSRVAIGFEESGLAFRFRFAPHASVEKKQSVLTVGLGYDVRIETDSYRNTLHEFHIKAGVLRDIAIFERLRLGVYIEAMEKMKQFEADPLLGESRFNVYPVWATKVRVGAIMSIFCLKNFMLTYRIGIEGAYFTPPYYVNESKTELVKFGNGTFKVGLSGYETNLLETLFNNIGIFFSF